MVSRGTLSMEYGPLTLDNMRPGVVWCAVGRNVDCVVVELRTRCVDSRIVGVVKICFRFMHLNIP